MSVTPLIQMFMLSRGRSDPLLAHVQASDIASAAIFSPGMVAMIALFGIAWMADTFIANNEDAIVDALWQPRRELAVHDRARDLPRRRPDARASPRRRGR